MSRRRTFRPPSTPPRTLYHRCTAAQNAEIADTLLRGLDQTDAARLTELIAQAARRQRGLLPVVQAMRAQVEGGAP